MAVGQVAVVWLTVCVRGQASLLRGLGGADGYGVVLGYFPQVVAVLVNWRAEARAASLRGSLQISDRL